MWGGSWDEDQVRLESEQARKNWGMDIARKKESGLGEIDRGQDKIESQKFGIGQDNSKEKQAWVTENLGHNFGKKVHWGAMSNQ